MNIENMKALITHLEWEENPVGFDMGEWFSHRGRVTVGEDIRNIVKFHSCGTVACIAGHAAILSGLPLKDVSFWKLAEKWLGLTGDESRILFFGKWKEDPNWDDPDYDPDSDFFLSEITKEEAIAELQGMVRRFEA